jgi:hypothetical protein
MSETSPGESTTGASGLLDEAGNRIGGNPSRQSGEALVRFAEEQPVATALGALILGYILGKIF